jgi:hypothetical protein
MIVAPQEDGQLLLVTQPDHAQLAARLLALRRLEGLAGHPRQDDILFAVREHDNGWREADAVPRLDAATARPLDFRDCPTPLRQEVWLRGVTRYRERHPYACALIAEHARALHRGREGEDWAAFMEALASLQEELAARAGAEPRSWTADYRFLAWADAAALAAVGVWPRFDLPLGRGELRSGALHLQPFPFAGATHFELACRYLPDRPYASTADLAGALAQSRWTTVRPGVVPW